MAASWVRIIQCHSIAMGPAGQPRIIMVGSFSVAGPVSFIAQCASGSARVAAFLLCSSKLLRRAAPRHDSEATMATHFESLNSMSLRCYAQRKIVPCVVPHSIDWAWDCQSCSTPMLPLILAKLLQDRAPNQTSNKTFHGANVQKTHIVRSSISQKQWFWAANPSV